MSRGPTEDGVDRVGTVLAGRYALIRGIGAGGMGAVYEAEHLVTRRRVAVKLMHAANRWSAASVERFLREARIAAALGHPAIIDVLDAGRDDEGAPFLVFELLRGRSLAEALEADGPIAVRDALEVTAEVLAALGVAHARGVLHRDIKPDNVFLALDGRGERVVKLLDFGISKVARGVMADDSVSHSTGGLVVGTPLYMSPEQASAAQDLDARSDLWSLGVTLYELLTGDTPWPGREIPAVVYAICHRPHAPPSRARPDVPPAVDAILARALQKDREARYATAEAMLADVRAALANAPTGAPGVIARPSGESSAPALAETALRAPSSRPRVTARASRRRAVILAAAATTALAAAAFASLAREAPPAAPQVQRPRVEPPPVLATPAAPSAPVLAAPDAGTSAVQRRVAPTRPTPRLARPAASAPPVAPAPASPSPSPSPVRRGGLAPVTDIDSM